MSIIRITRAMPTPEERKGLNLREQKKDEAEKLLTEARQVLSRAQAAQSRARRAHRKALDDLTTYRNKIDPSNR